MTDWAILRLLYDVLGRHAREWATLLLTFGLFAYAAWRPEPARIVAAVLFAIIAHLPTWMRGSHGKEKVVPSGRDQYAEEDERARELRMRDVPR